MAIKKYSDYIKEQQNNTTLSKQTTNIQKYSDYVRENGIKTLPGVTKQYETAKNRTSSAKSNLKKYYENEGIITGNNSYSAPNLFTVREAERKNLETNGLTLGKTLLPSQVERKEQENIQKYNEVTKNNANKVKILKNKIDTAKNDEVLARSDYQVLKAQSDYENASTLGKASQILQSPLRGFNHIIFGNENYYTDENGKKYTLPNYMDSLNSTIANQGGFIAKAANEVGTQIGKQGASALLNAIAPYAGSAAYSLRMAEDTYNSALREGYSEKQAATYATISTITEYATQKILGAGVGRFKGNSPFEEFVSEKLKPIIKSEAVNKMLSTMTSEGTEEFAQEYLDQINRNVTLGEKEEIFTKERLIQAGYSALIGALSSGATEGSGIIMRNNIQKTSKQLIYDIEKETNTNLSKEEKAHLYNSVFESAIQNEGRIDTNIIKENFNSTETKRQISSDIEETIETLEEYKKQTESKNQQKKIDTQINELKEQLGTIQKQVQQKNNTLEKQLENQATRILEESEAQREAMIENFKDYLEEHSIINPTQQDIDDSITDLVSYDNDLDFADTARVEQLYNQYVKEYMQENGIPFNNVNNSYRGSHQIENAKPLIDLNIKDIENKVTELNGYLTNQDQSDLRKLNKIFSNPNEDIKIYRAAPVNELNSGDWVTTDKSYAKEVANNNGGKVYEYTIKPNQLYYPDNIRELPSLHRLSSFQYIENTQPILPMANNLKQDIKLPTQNVEKRNAVSDNLESYSQEEANSILRKENNVIVENKQELANYVREALNNPNSNKNLHLGIIPNETIQRIKDEVQNIKSEKIDTLFKDNINYALAVKQEEIRHMKKESLTQQDIVGFIDSVDELIAQFDTVSYTLYGNQNALKFKKAMNDGTHIALEVISNKNHTLRTHTLFLDQVDFENKKRTLSPTLDELNNSPSKTSEMDGLSVLSDSNNTINLPKSQIAPLPNNSNMQNNEKNVMLPSARVQNEINEMEGLKAADEAFGLNEEETKILDSLRKKYDKEYITEKKFKTAEKKILSQTTNEANINLGLTAKESKEFKEKLKKLTNNTKEELTNELAKDDVRKIISDYSERTITHENTDIAEIKREIRNENIKVSDYLKSQITDYSNFKKRNFGKLKLTSEGIPVDSFYEELKSEYPSYFSSDVINDADILETLADFMNKDTTYEETLKLPDEEINEITDKVYDKLINNALTLDEIENIDKEIFDRINKKTRQDVREQLLKEMNITTDDLQVGKDISSLDFQRTDPIRVNEKVFGYKIGNKINDATIRQTKHNEAERIRYLNKERSEIADLGIKAHSKESAAVQKYGEKQYVTDKGTIVPYGDVELMSEFPDVDTQNKIKNAAKEIRKKYDAYIDKINSVITEMGYDPIPKRQDYFRHFQEIGDKLSQWGIPLNADSMSKDTLPTDINGITDQFKPGKNWFASAIQRKGIKTTYDAITGIDGYLEGASNLIYHTEDIQRYRTLSKLVRDTYGQTHGLDNINLETKEGQQRLNDIFDNKLSKYAAWLDEQANALSGKKGTIDRGIERALGRRIYNILDAAKKQVGSNMTGFNVRSALTNFASAVQGASKTNKLAWIKGTISTMQNIIHDDGLINKSDFLTSRFGSDQLSKKLWQKASNAGQIFMTGTDYFTANQIWRSKYYENLSKGMSETQVIKSADDFAARIMGDRSKGSTAEVFNSKTLGLLTQFQLEVNNQWSSIIHDNKIDIQSGNKSGATVMFQLGQLAAMSYFFNNFMKSLTGSDVMIDPIDMLKKILGGDDDDDDDKKTLEERAREAFGDLVDDIPFANLLTGGGKRIPIAEAFKGLDTGLKYVTGQKDKYGNDIKLPNVGKDLIESGFYWLLPTGYGQIKKTVKGVSMYNKNLPIAGSYTDSGNLRFTADETLPGMTKAALFGQYSSKEAQNYIDSGYKTTTASHIKELKDLGMTSSEYVKYRSGLNSAGTTNSEKINYIANSDYTDKQKNIMAQNILNRDFDIKEYKKYNSYEEYDYAYKNPEKYAVISQIAPYDNYVKYKNELKTIRDNTINDKEETIKYINNLKLSIPQKAMFIKQYYKSFNGYNSQIIDYINKQKLSKEEKTTILTNLGFTVKDGRVYS